MVVLYWIERALIITKVSLIDAIHEQMILIPAFLACFSVSINVDHRMTQELRTFTLQNTIFTNSGTAKTSILVEPCIF